MQLAEPKSCEYSHCHLKAASKDLESPCLFEVRRGRLHPADPAGDGQQQCVHGTCRVDQTAEELEKVLAASTLEMWPQNLGPEAASAMHFCVVFM